MQCPVNECNLKRGVRDEHGDLEFTCTKCGTKFTEFAADRYIAKQQRDKGGTVNRFGRGPNKRPGQR